MTPDDFLNRLNHDDIVAAIQAAELRTSGEIRVFVSHQSQTDAMAAARQHFAKLGMDQTAARNGVLIYVAPRAQTFAVIGDSGVNAKCGESFWTDLAVSMQARFRQGEFTQGILEAVHRTGEVLALHFPRQSDDRNELPDAVSTDR